MLSLLQTEPDTTANTLFQRLNARVVRQTGNDIMTTSELWINALVGVGAAFVGAGVKAIADIQLFGSAPHVALAKEFAPQFALDGTAPLDPLLSLLRQELRDEILLEKEPSHITYLRMSFGCRTSGDASGPWVSNGMLPDGKVEREED